MILKDERDMPGASVSQTGLSQAEPEEVSALTGFDPSRIKHWGDGQTACNVEDDYGCQQEADEREDEAELYREAEQDEIRCALALFRSLSRDFGEYRAVKVDGPLNWTITKPRSSDALLSALETDQPLSPIEAATPIVQRLNAWERFQTNRYGWSPPDGKRIEVRVGDLRQLRTAIATEARRAETENTGSVHEGAIPQGDAQ